MDVQNPQQRTYKIAVVGSNSVGKTSIIRRYLEGRFRDDYFPTICDTYTLTKSVDSQIFQLEVMDTSGIDNDMDWFLKLCNERVEREKRRFGLVVVYAIDNSDSFKKAKGILDELQDERLIEKLSCILIGNKIDLEATREVELESAQNISNKHSIKIMEVSAKEDDNMEPVFASLVQEMELQQMKFCTKDKESRIVDAFCEKNSCSVI